MQVKIDRIPASYNDRMSLRDVFEKVCTATAVDSIDSYLDFDICILIPMSIVEIYSSWHFTLLREQGRLRNKPKLFQVKIDKVTPTKLANRNSLGHFAVGNKFTG